MMRLLLLASLATAWAPSHLVRHRSVQLQSSTKETHGESTPSFLRTAFLTECDNTNRPPSLNILLRSLDDLLGRGGSSDIRGRFVDHYRVGSLASVAHTLGKIPVGSVPPLTPFAAYCLGAGLAKALKENNEDTVTILLGRDPRLHGERLTDALARGAESIPGVQCYYTGIATTPACATLVPDKATAAIMVTASHLPPDRNGFKIFGDVSKEQLWKMGEYAAQVVSEWYSHGILPPSSGHVMCTQWVDWMPEYAERLRSAIVSQSSKGDRPLEGFKIVLNAGNGAGGFFNQVLADLGADMSGSIHIEGNGDFPNGVPNPESQTMIDATLEACRRENADLGIMLDTDADRCGFVVPRTVMDDGKRSDYEPLNRNRLIALLAVVIAEEYPGGSIVTDSVTSEGLATFIEGLGLSHIRYLKGYANVINKAKETDSELAIETSGHCAFQENRYLDDGTYVAVKVVSLLSRLKEGQSLLGLIADLVEVDEVAELRMTAVDGSLDTMQRVFDFCALEVERLAEVFDEWTVDRDNLEGIRVRLDDGQFFMLRKSLHDPIISLQIEAKSKDVARRLVTKPLLSLFEDENLIRSQLGLDVLHDY